MLKKISLTMAALLALSAAPFVSAESKTITGNQIGTYGDFDYELWRDRGDANMVLNDDGTFTCSWDKSSTGNVLYRTGKKLGSKKTHDQYGDISLTYGCDYKPSGNSYLCVYGWTVEPLVEYYVVESWGTWKPPGAKSKGTVEIDGAAYDIYETTRVNQPSIQGTKTFQQYWSVRQDKQTEGTVSVSKHFKAWEEQGMELGKLYEVSLCVEGYMSSGSANVYSNSLSYGDTTIGTVPEPEPEETPAESPAPEETPAVTESPEPEEAPAADSPSVWAVETVARAVKEGIVPASLQSGYEQPITRAEFCALTAALYETLIGEINGRTQFADTNDPNVQKMGSLGVVFGIAPSVFDPHGTLTREQAAAMLCRLANAMDKPFPAAAPAFADNEKLSPYAIEPVGQVQQAGIMQGVGGNTFDPAGSYTREMSILTVMRIYDYIIPA